MDSPRMYDSLSADYDRFVDWPARLAVEIPFLERLLREAGARTVLDSACGTGRHAVALSGRGFAVSGADASAGMIARARANMLNASADVRFEKAAFGEMARIFGAGAFDALLCLGNSLPHMQTSAGLNLALRDFSDCLKPGGLLIIQNRNFDSVLARRERWMPPQAYREGEKEWLFLRFYEFEEDGSLTFQMVVLRRANSLEWSQTVNSARLLPLREADLSVALAAASFRVKACYGYIDGTSFDAEKSENLIVIAESVPSSSK